MWQGLHEGGTRAELGRHEGGTRAARGQHEGGTGPGRSRDESDTWTWSEHGQDGDEDEVRTGLERFRSGVGASHWLAREDRANMPVGSLRGVSLAMAGARL